MTPDDAGVVKDCAFAPDQPGPAAADAGTRGSGAKWAVAASVAAAAVALDLLVKRLVQATDFSAYEVLPYLTIRRQVNRGVAFGLLWEQRSLILAAAALALVVILLYLRMETRPIYGGISVGLLLGGSLGNLYERVVRGEVTDYVSFWFWPTFNLADVFIVAGVLLVAVGLLWGHPPGDRDG